MLGCGSQSWHGVWAQFLCWGWIASVSLQPAVSLQEFIWCHWLFWKPYRPVLFLSVLLEAGCAGKTMPTGEVAMAGVTQHLLGWACGSPGLTMDLDRGFSAGGALTALRHNLTERCSQTGASNRLFPCLGQALPTLTGREQLEPYWV